MHTPAKNDRISAQLNLQLPKPATMGTFKGGVCGKAQFLATGIILGTRRHPKDVPFVSFGARCSYVQHYSVVL